MIKDVDGLPMEMLSIIRSLLDNLKIAQLIGINQDDMSTTYSNTLYKLKIAADNKNKYKEVTKEALKNGAWNEYAIAMNGDLVVLDSETGLISTVDLKTYKNNSNDYKLLTVALLGYLREWDPRLNMDLEVFNIIGNSIGYYGFLALLEKSVKELGSSSLSRRGYFTNEGLASKGLEVMLDLSEEDLERLKLSGGTVEGMYEYNIVDKSKYSLIKALTSYLSLVMPDNVKTWAAIKKGMDDPLMAIELLIFEALIPGNTESHIFDIKYKGSIAKVTGAGKNGSKSKEADPLMGFWGEALVDLGGSDSSFNLMVENGTLTVEGKFYGTTPGMDKDQSLNDYLAKSGVSYIRNTSPITFGDVTLSTDSFNDVMVKAGSGAYIVTLPIKGGKVWIEAVKVYSDFKKQLKGLEEGSLEYIRKVKELLSLPEYAPLSSIFKADGKLNPNNAGHFLVLEGLASSKTAGLKDGKKTSLDDIESDFIINAGDDEDLYRVLSAGLSSKERGEYKLDYKELYDLSAILFDNYDKIYKGNIYIPLNNNAISAAHADKNKLKESTVYRYERDELDWEKTNSLEPTDSKSLWE